MIQGMEGHCQQHFCRGSPLESKTRLGAGQAEEFQNLRAEEPLEVAWLQSGVSRGSHSGECVCVCGGGG